MSDSGPEWPFDLWLKTAVRGFGLSPAAFWAMSVRDWLSLLATRSEQGLDRMELSTLMNNYPDYLGENTKRDDHD